MYSKRKQYKQPKYIRYPIYAIIYAFLMLLVSLAFILIADRALVVHEMQTHAMLCKSAKVSGNPYISNCNSEVVASLGEVN